MYKIGELSKLCRISVKTLRYYDSEGLLIPDEIDKFTGYRYYSASKLIDCSRILAFKEMGFTLEEIKRQMRAKDTADILDLITSKESEFRNVIAQTESKLRRLEYIKQNIAGGEKHMFNSVSRNTDTLRVASLRKIFKTKKDALVEIEKMKNLLPKNIIDKRSILINYETEHCEIDFDLAVCVEITGEIPYPSEYVEKTIEFACDVSTLVCNKDELEKSYFTMLKELEQNAYQITGAFYEIYHDDHTAELKVPVCKLSKRSKTTRKDDIDLPFENDEDVIGHWDVIDYVPTKEHFNMEKIKFTGGKLFKEFYFLPNGERYWCFSWTKDYLLCLSGDGETCSKYEAFKIGDETYMYLEFKGGDYIYHNGQLEYLILKQTDKKEYLISDFAIKDEIKYEFISDDYVIGKWLSVDFVENENKFEADEKKFDNELWCEYLVFESDGTITGKYNGREIYLPERFVWTKGSKIDLRESISENYHIEKINNKDYLFLECKNGDYIYGSRAPWYYVFVRAEGVVNIC